MWLYIYRKDQLQKPGWPSIGPTRTNILPDRVLRKKFRTPQDFLSELRFFGPGLDFFLQNY